MLDEKFLSEKVHSLLSQSTRVNGVLEPPIDPERLADLCGVLSVEHRPMVPEGVLSPIRGGFRLYIQSNFADWPNVSFRQRFTIAHELVHTFYYDLNGGVPRRKKDAPKGQVLERLCHSGAGQILVPEVLLRREIDIRGAVASAEDFLKLARVFNVSADVMIRRIHKLGLMADDNFAAILVDGLESDNRMIQAACYRPILLCHANKPRPGLNFDSWLLPLLASSGNSEASEWIHTTRIATISAKKVCRSKRSFILELRFGPPHLNTA
jgi:hypothetical protein